jgi:hypothetical protein
MPLRDHFRPPLDDTRHWEGFHATWPVMIVAQLRRSLPRGFFAEPRVHSGLSLYEVLVYDENRHRQFVASVKIVGPKNKDRSEDRHGFASRCAGLLREGVSVIIVDVVTTRTQNLYVELLDAIGLSDPGQTPEPLSLYSTAYRLNRRENKWWLETWVEPLTLGQPLPTVPLWLADNLAIPLDLEECYEQSCNILNIPGGA